MSAQGPGYEESRSALNWPLLTCWLFAPVAAAMILLTLAIVVTPAWPSPLMGGVLVLVLIGSSLLYRNWPTGIRVDDYGITVGAIRSRRARTREPSAYHQSWGV
jgi:uncharacterized RDD family membrane protein YckC